MVEVRGVEGVWEGAEERDVCNETGKWIDINHLMHGTKGRYSVPKETFHHYK